jgi:hypothetical protein
MQNRKIICAALVAMVISLVPACLRAQSKNDQNQSVTVKTNNHMDYKVNIGKIIVPKDAIQEFRKQASVTPKFLKNLAGYVNGDYYEMYDEAGNLLLMSIVTWENESYYKNAQIELKKYYEQINFNRMEFIKRLNVSVEYGTYEVAEMN